MPFPRQIRVLALGLIQDGDRIFVSEGYDPKKQQTFYRALGGGVDFGETSLDGLQREFREELGAELTNIRYLGCIENIFVYDGEPGHELVQLFRCDFVDPKFYQSETVTFQEGDFSKTALWVKVDRFRSGELHLVPETFLDYV
jgi:8-oxo-dGTP pyrophosphatase MutT (NUDIX family)